MINAESFSSPAKYPKSIAIIGGGIASACAIEQIFAQSQNAKVTLYCADNELASRASGNKQGAVYPLLQGSKSNIAELLANCYQFATDYYQQIHQSGIDFQHQWCGVLQQAIKPELEERYQKVAAFWPEIVEYVDEKRSCEIARLEVPFPSLYFSKGGWLWPQQFCQQLLHNLQSKFDLTIRVNTEVTELTSLKNHVWQINGKDNFDAVIVATGFQTSQFDLTSGYPTEPVRGQVSRLKPDTKLAQLNTVLCHKGYITPSQGEYQCFGATFEKNSTYELNKEEDQTTNLNQIKTIYANQSWAQSLQPNDVFSNKAGIRATTKDHLPMVGEIVSDDWLRRCVDKNTGKIKRQDKLPDELKDELCSDLYGLYLFTGLGARGLTTAPLLAQHLISKLFGGESKLPSSLHSAIAPIRFKIKHLKKHKSL